MIVSLVETCYCDRDYHIGPLAAIAKMEAPQLLMGCTMVHGLSGVVYGVWRPCISTAALRHLVTDG